MKCKNCKTYLSSGLTLACTCGTFCNKTCMDIYHFNRDKKHKAVKGEKGGTE